MTISIEDKQGNADQNGYYMSYNVARGLKYKLEVNSFGFRQDNIVVQSSNTALGQITKENGEYYLNITENAIDYSNKNNQFEIVIEAIQSEGENIRQAGSKTKITIFEYVVNYNVLNDGDADIVTGSGDGILNVQVGSQIDLSLDLFDFVEYKFALSVGGHCTITF